MYENSNENKLKDSCNVGKETTSSIKVENEAIVNPTVEKNKNNRKSKKKKNKSKFNAENETADNANPESETAVAEMNQISNASSEIKTTDNAKAEQEVIDAGNTKLETVDNIDSKQEILNKADSDQEIKCNYDVDPENSDEAHLNADYDDDINVTTNYFVYNFRRYLKRCYEIFIWRRSDIEEKSIDLPRACQVLLRGSIGRYISTNFYNMYYPYAYLENPAKELEKAFSEEMLSAAVTATHSEFLCFAALFFFASFDLQSFASLEDAPKSAFVALVNSILSSKQRDLIEIWDSYEG